MHKAVFTIRVMIAFTAWLVSTVLFAQNAGPSPNAEIVLVRLAPLAYPLLARGNMISGEVELTVEIRRDGSVGSVQLQKGVPLLAQAALDNAKQSQFECRNCADTIHEYQITYVFELAAMRACPETEAQAKARAKNPYPRVTHSKDRVVIVDQPSNGSCDPPVSPISTKARSIKCIYLWKCG